MSLLASGIDGPVHPVLRKSEIIFFFYILQYIFEYIRIRFFFGPVDSPTVQWQRCRLTIGAWQTTRVTLLWWGMSGRILSSETLTSQVTQWAIMHHSVVSRGLLTLGRTGSYSIRRLFRLRDGNLCRGCLGVIKRWQCDGTCGAADLPCRTRECCQTGTGMQRPARVGSSPTWRFCTLDVCVQKGLALSLMFLALTSNSTVCMFSHGKAAHTFCR